MKRFIFLNLFLLALCFSSARTIHWITFVDTSDPDIGSYDVYGRKFLYSQWVNKVNAALAQCGYSARIYDYYGDGTSPVNCKKVIENFKCDSSDVVIFYYMGHGGRSYTDKSKFPQMLLAQNSDNKCVPLTWVHESLSKCNPRFLLTIGMCCNSFDPSMTPKETIAFYPNNGIAQYTIDEMQSIRQLFLENSGDIIVSSSCVGQPSWALYIPGLNQSMDIFTYKLISGFNKYVKESNNPSWTVLLGRTATEVNNYMLGIGKIQMPQYLVNVRKTKLPPPPPNNDDKNDSKIDDQSNDLAQDMTTVFDNLISTRVPLADRMRRASILKGMFTGNAVVKILAEDTDFVVDKMAVSDFLDIICTSKVYFKIIVSEVKTNGDMFEEIKVREYIMKK